MRLRAITTREEANRFLPESYLGEWNRKFTVAAAQPESAFVPPGGKDSDRIFSLQQERVVNRDNTVSVGGRVLQIDRVRWRGTLAGCHVTACEHLYGTVSVYYGPHLVARFLSDAKNSLPAKSCGKGAAWPPPANRGFHFPTAPATAMLHLQPDRSSAHKSGHLDLLTTALSRH